MGLPEIVAVVIAVGSLLVSLVTVASKVKVGEFQILREMVDALDTDAKRLRVDLRAAEQKIEDLEEENRALRADLQTAERKIADLEDENRDLLRRLRGAPAAHGVKAV